MFSLCFPAVFHFIFYFRRWIPWHYSDLVDSDKMNGPRGGGGESDPLDLYQVFQTSYNKIAKSEFPRGDYPDPASDVYQPDSRFFPFDTSSGHSGHSATKSSKQDTTDMRSQWSSYGDSPSSSQLSSGGYPSEPCLYYQDQPPDWGYASQIYPGHYPAGYGGSSQLQQQQHSPQSSYPGPARPQPSSQQTQIDEAINMLRSHVDFSQVVSPGPSWVSRPDLLCFRAAMFRWAPPHCRAQRITSGGRDSWVRPGRAVGRPAPATTLTLSAGEVGRGNLRRRLWSPAPR